MPNNLALTTATYGIHVYQIFINWNIPLEVVDNFLGYVFENRSPRIDISHQGRLALLLTIFHRLRNLTNLYGIIVCYGSHASKHLTLLEIFRGCHTVPSLLRNITKTNPP